MHDMKQLAEDWCRIMMCEMVILEIKPEASDPKAIIHHNESASSEWISVWNEVILFYSRSIFYNLGLIKILRVDQVA
jgi:hypothetical protein